ncbi:MAG: cobalamin-dependent protein [Treponema sp.]|jgi:methanogenic corrinoid protein MtbC1|nr:cobalamin-dependent protein [Treponema sp.]
MDLQKISISLQSGKAREMSNLISRAMEENYSIDSILRQGLIPGIVALEERFRKSEIFIPEFLIAARAINLGVKMLRPSPDVSAGTVIIGTVKGDMRDTEKNLIAVLMEGMGLRVIDLGAGISPEKFIDAAKGEKAQVVICTAAHTSSMLQMKFLVQAFAADEIRNQIKVLVTGAPVTEKFCRIIGADLYAPNVVGAAELAAAQCKKVKP